MAAFIFPTVCLVLMRPFVFAEDNHHHQRQLSSYVDFQLRSLQFEIDDMKKKFDQHETTIAQQTTKLREQEAKIQKRRLLMNQLSDMLSNDTIGTGTVYTRWGKTNCTNNASLVYSGFTAGTYYYSGTTGSSSLSVCIPSDPIWSVPEPTAGTKSTLYSTAYGFDIFTHKVTDQLMPCAVCLSRPDTETLMIPGRNRCYNDWSEEYKGFLVGPRANYASEDFLCVDENPEGISDGPNGVYDRRFYLVTTTCGSLNCPPYANDKIVTCVVCSY